MDKNNEYNKYKVKCMNGSGSAFYRNTRKYHNVQLEWTSNISDIRVQDDHDKNDIVHEKQKCI